MVRQAAQTCEKNSAIKCGCENNGGEYVGSKILQSGCGSLYKITAETF